MTNNKQQTGVEWLIEQFYNNVGMLTSKKLLKAKEMEKERIIKAYNEDLHGGLSGHRKFNDGEDYYNKTYGDGK
jgi:hypothetical protein